MAGPEVEQKLAAILAADVAGYTRLMADDEVATLAALDAARAIFRTHIEAERGRVVDTAGDSVLAVFATATGAVRAAAEVQKELAEADHDVPEARRMRFRIGVNLGEVMEKEDGSIYGAGVNVAARLEGLAEPGGVMISGKVHEEIEGRLPFGLADAGTHAVKNIDRPVRAYRVLAEGETAPKTRATLRSPKALFAVVVAVVALAGIAAWQITRAPVPDEVAGDQTPSIRDKPSIAVLPFTNMSGDAEQDYFADGISEDIITELSRFDGLLVIARNSTFRFKGRAVDIGEVAAALGVRYVLEGSVRRFDDRVRITAQLIDVETGGHLWAERYDRELTDVFAVQDDVTQQIIGALRSELGEVTATRASRALTGNTEAYDLYLQARVLKDRRTQETNRQAQQMFLRAIDLDPAFAAAYAELGFARFLAYLYGWSDEGDIIGDALAVAEKAVALDPSLPVAHDRLGLIRGFQGDLDAGIAAAREAIALDANYANGYSTLALMLAFAGDTDEAITLLDRALRLDPYSAVALFYRGLAYFVRENYDQAITTLKSSLALNPNFGAAHQFLAAIYGLLGYEEKAQAQATEVLRLTPNFAYGILQSPFRDRAVLMRLIEGLRKAGLEVPDPSPTR